MKTKIAIGLAVIIGIAVTMSFFSNDESTQEVKEINSKELVLANQYFDSEFLFEVYWPLDEIVSSQDGNALTATSGYVKTIPENEMLYEELAPLENTKTIVIIPMFTAMAYSENGFYDYYTEKCDATCLTVKIKPELELTHNSSNLGAQVLRILGYEWTTDLKVEQNPEILVEYDRVILLHNEYVTKNMFEAINSHPNVIYLYPNALYAEISVDYEDESITLIQGHNYPEPEIENGFGWEFDNTHPYEYDTTCENWEFYEIDNGFMLNCYPENAIVQSKELLETIKIIGT